MLKAPSVALSSGPRSSKSFKATACGAADVPFSALPFEERDIALVVQREILFEIVQGVYE